MSNRNAPTTIGIIGCGWLGKALTQALVTKQHAVVATTQCTNNIAIIEKLGATAEILSLPLIDHDETRYEVFEQRSLVICIPPQLKTSGEYAQKIAQLVQRAERGGVNKLILISSTAIYNGLTGLVDEASELDYHADKVAILSAAEKQILAFSGHHYVLRLSGLVGPQRHPGRFLQGMKTLSDPYSHVNLIHQTDAVGIISYLLECNAPSGIYNGVSQTNSTKLNYYNAAAKALGLSPPNFIPDQNMSVGKKISGVKVRDHLAYPFVFDDLLKWLQNNE